MTENTNIIKKEEPKANSNDNQPAAKPRYANITHPNIEAASNQLFRFGTIKQAEEKLDWIRNNFTISRQQPDQSQQSAVLLWIRGYSITAEEERKGFMGNYGMISYARTEDHKITLYITKIDSELKYHPQRKRPKNRHPNWGHPILRHIKKGRVFNSVQDAQDELQRLHEEFPEVTIPCTGKMYAMIYTRKAKPPVKKFVLEIVVNKEGGGFIIETSENTYQAPEKTEEEKAAETQAEEQTEQSGNQGYFSSMVELQRAKKKKPVKASPGATAAAIEKEAEEAEAELNNAEDNTAEPQEAEAEEKTDG